VWLETDLERAGPDEAHAVTDSVAVRAALAPKQRAVIVLRYFEDLTEAQTAGVLGCRVGTPKNR
jgi:DNA-directed RNA polymerase specialized sigma24 family protein